MFPVYIYERGSQLPAEGNYYVVARNGLYLRKNTGLIRALVPVSGIAFLEPLDLSAQLLLPKLPQELIVRTLLFFRAVYRKHRSEAVVLLHYNAATKEFMIHCPEQQVSAAGVHYDLKERFEGYQLVGTIHSHSNFNAFHSGIDYSNEKYFDGLHITIGHMDQPYFTISCSMMVNGKRFTFEPEEVIIGIKPVNWQKKSFVTHRRPVISHMPTTPAKQNGLIERFFDSVIGDLSATDFTPSLTTPAAVTTYKSEQFWDITMPEGQDYRHVGFPKNWLDKVSPQTFAGSLVTSFTPSGQTVMTKLTAVSNGPQSFEPDPGEIGDGGHCFWGPNNRYLGV